MEASIIWGHPHRTSLICRIVVGNDASAAATAAVDTADLIAARCDAQLTIANHATMLRPLQVFRTPHIARQERTVTGDFVDAMIQSSAQADLLVVGAHGDTAAESRARTATALRIEERAASSVLIDRRDPDRHRGQATWRRILVGLSESASSQHGLAIANELAKCCSAELTVARVVSLATLTFSTRAAARADDYTSTLVVGARARLQAKIDGLEPSCPNHRIVVPVGDPADILIALASGFDLAVIGSGRSSAKPTFDAGGVAARVAMEATCSVLIAR